MEALKYLKEKERMCYKQEDCTHCPLKTDDDNTCSILEETNPEKAVEIVEKWSAENPQKTILQDFLEKYPNAILSDDDKRFPLTICPYALGYENYEDRICNNKLANCTKCWNRPLEG